MQKIQWLPAGRVSHDDGPGYLWVGFTSARSRQAYFRTFIGERYAQLKIMTPGEGPEPDDYVALYHEMLRALPTEEIENLPYDQVIGVSPGAASDSTRY